MLFSLGRCVRSMLVYKVLHSSAMHTSQCRSCEPDLLVSAAPSPTPSRERAHHVAAAWRDGRHGAEARAIAACEASLLEYRAGRGPWPLETSVGATASSAGGALHAAVLILISGILRPSLLALCLHSI